MADEMGGTITTATDIERPPANIAELAQKWIAEIQAAEKAQKKWVTRAQKIEKIYNDERDIDAERKRKFNILWSNVETLRPAAYMQTPQAKAVRRYRDRDPVARLASMMLERCLQTLCELYEFDHQMDQAVRDRLVVGRGQAWVFYVPEFAGEGANQVLAYQTAIVEYVPWQDFLHSVCRTWSENRWVARCFYKTRRELRQWLQELQLDPTPADRVSLDVSVTGDKIDEGLKDERGKAKVWEIHSKDDQKVIYVAPSSSDDAILGMKPPPTKFRDFWPCPRPMLATTVSKSLIPTPDYALYQDQAEELNKANERIGVLQKALKVAGWYDASASEIARVLEAGDNIMVPVKNWQSFMEGGGNQGRVGFFPLDVVIKTLEGLYKIRDEAKQTLYEVSGLGDILRGETDPRETLGAQKLKSNWGSLRIRRVQKDVQRFAADIMRLKAEIVAEQFRFPLIMQMAGVDEELIAKYVPLPPMPQMAPSAPQPGMDPAVAQMQAQAQQQAAMAQWQQAKNQAVQQFLAQVEKLLRDDTARSFRIDVETDSTLEPDQQDEKQTAVEFTTALTGFMEKAAPMAAASPEAAKMIGQLLTWAVRRFGDGTDELEQAIEQAVDAASKPQPQKPDPALIKAQSDAQTAQAKVQIAQQTAAANIQAQQAKTQSDAQARAVETQTKAQAQQTELVMEAQSQQAEIAAMWTKLTAELEALKAKTTAQVAASQATQGAANDAD